MKRLMLLAFIALPVVAEAQSDSAPKQTIYNADYIAVVAHQLVNCGIRNQEWARGVYALAMGNTEDAIEELEKTHLSAAAGNKIWMNLATAITLNYPVSAHDCANYANNTKLLTDMDIFSSLGKVGD